MKKKFLLAASIALLAVASCRENDNMMSPQDSVTLKIVQDNNKNASSAKAIGMSANSQLEDASVYGDPARPPKK